MDHLLINEELGLHHSTDASESAPPADSVSSSVLSPSSSSPLSRERKGRKRRGGRGNVKEEEQGEEGGEVPEKQESHVRSKRVAELYCGVCVWPPRPTGRIDKKEGNTRQFFSRCWRANSCVLSPGVPELSLWPVYSAPPRTDNVPS